MADKDEIEVTVEDDAVVVDLPEDGADKHQETKEKKPRVRLQEPEDDEEQTDAVAEATKALQEAKAAQEKAERDVAAAQATAASERQRREAAERQASQRGREADAARAEAETAQLALLDRGIQGAKGEMEAYTGQLANAFEVGDFKLAADIQAKLGQASAKLDRLEAQKDDVATRRPIAETTEGRVEAPAGSQLDNYLSSFAPEAQNWLRQHPECLPPAVGGTSAANAKMMQGHYAAIEQNITPNTVDYFRVIEEHTGHRAPVSAAGVTKKAGEDEGQTQRKPAAQQRAQPSAPPSRDVPIAGRQPTRRGSVTLSKDQQDTAKMSFPHLPEKEAFAQYARNLVELEAEGKIGRTTH